MQIKILNITSASLLKNSNLLFFLLFNISIIPLFPGPYGNVLTSGSVFIFLIYLFLSLFIGKISDVFRNHRYTFDIILIFWIFLAMLISCVINFGYAVKNPNAFKLMASALVSYTSLIISYVLFKELNSSKFYKWPMFMLTFVFGIAIFEFIDFDSAKLILKYTMGKANLIGGKISSIFPSTTEFGPFCVIGALFFIIRYLKAESPPLLKQIELLVGSLAVFGVFLSGSRTALIGFFIGLVLLIFIKKALSLKKTSILLLMIVVIFHTIAFTNPYVARQSGSILPYISKMQRGHLPKPVDFVPVLDLNNLTNRSQRWSKAIELWKTSPIFGIGIGQFNVKSGFGWVGNVHNVYLNLLAEGGVFLITPLFLLLCRIAWKHRFSALLPVTVSLLSMAFVENSYDHLLPWNFFIAWVLTTSLNSITEERNFSDADST